ncbi:DUF2231 domain-containing protein [Sulfurimonas sp. HSL3-7]|uniref:DUF2231 domain-containing protein n=1 Tax=Sulfonitrofixus jiaomeiensis TaxID=3131938 RepID=UPI0031F9FE60
MMLHPATAHFAVVLPVVASVFGLIYMATRSEGMSKIYSRLLVFAALGVIAAWYTGSQAGPDAYPLLSDEGQHELIEHKTLGLYLAIAFGVITLIQFAGCQMKKFQLEALALILLLAATGAVFIQGKDGGELTYEYGAGVEKHADGLDCLENPDDYIEEDDEAEDEEE